MIKRLWHGWTTPENADEYETLLKTEIIPGIAAKAMAGYRGIEVLRRRHGDEVEFVTIMTFDSWDAIEQLVGEDLEVAYVPAQAQAVLSRWDARTQLFEVRTSISE